MATNSIDEWNKRFARSDYVFGEAPNAFLAGQADRVSRHARALAVADGEGRNGVWLAEQGLDVLSLDGSDVALDKARALAERRGVSITTETADLLDHDWSDEAFDLVVAIFIQFAGPEGRDAMFAGMKRALAPGGTLLLEGYRPEQIGYGTGGPPYVENLYTEALLREAFADLEIVSLRAYDAEVAEGPGHHGMSALIDMIATKPLG